MSRQLDCADEGRRPLRPVPAHFGHVRKVRAIHRKRKGSTARCPTSRRYRRQGRHQVDILGAELNDFGLRRHAVPQKKEHVKPRRNGGVVRRGNGDAPGTLRDAGGAKNTLIHVVRMGHRRKGNPGDACDARGVGGSDKNALPSARCRRGRCDRRPGTGKQIGGRENFGLRVTVAARYQHTRVGQQHSR